MSLKQIPQEYVTAQSHFAKKRKEKYRHAVHEKMKNLEAEKDSRTIHKAYVQLSRFLINEKGYGLPEITNLTYDLERALLSLQRKKRHLFEKKKKKSKY